METASQDPLLPLLGIMQRHGATCTLAEFHAAVNVTFHEFESEVYDQEHADMWNSLPREVRLLADDCLLAAPDLPDNLRLLDIGCGTGLASQCLLWTDLGKKVKSVDLLDTSPSMLRQAEGRAASWKIPFQLHNGLLSDLKPQAPYDLIITSSVLHHVPDLPGFLAGVRQRQAPRGIFIHIQDPNADYMDDPDLIRRRAEFVSTRVPESISRLSPARILRRLYRELTGTPSDHYVDKANRALVEKGIIKTPLTFQEIYSITDIHVEDGGGGISLRKVREWLPDYDSISQRSYGFFSALASNLPAHMTRIEDELSQAKALNGLHVGAAWRRR